MNFFLNLLIIAWFCLCTVSSELQFEERAEDAFDLVCNQDCVMKFSSSVDYCNTFVCPCFACLLSEDACDRSECTQFSECVDRENSEVNFDCFVMTGEKEETTTDTEIVTDEDLTTTTENTFFKTSGQKTDKLTTTTENTFFKTSGQKTDKLTTTNGEDATTTNGEDATTTVFVENNNNNEETTTESSDITDLILSECISKCVTEAQGLMTETSCGLICNCVINRHTCEPNENCGETCDEFYSCADDFDRDNNTEAFGLCIHDVLNPPTPPETTILTVTTDTDATSDDNDPSSSSDTDSDDSSSSSDDDTDSDSMDETASASQNHAFWFVESW